MNPELPIDVDEARRRLASAVAGAVAGLPLGGAVEPVELRQCIGRVLAQSVVVEEAIPAVPVSAMDGYAIQSQSTLGERPVSLEIVGTASAGHPSAMPVAALSCIRIMTGAVIPAGADAVVMQEHTARDGNTLRLTGVVRSGTHIRAIGEEMPRGAIAIRAGRRLTASDVQRAASLGYAGLRLLPRLRVAVCSSGDEVLGLGQRLALGAVFDSNRQFLLAALDQLGVEPVDLGIVRDERAAVEHMLADACSRADVLITTGGASTGDADHIGQVLSDCADTVFAGIAMKPGRPTRMALIGRQIGRARSVPVFSLPGTPSAMMTAFYALVREALYQLSGAAPVPLHRCHAALLAPLRSVQGRTDYAPAQLTEQHGSISARPISKHRDGDEDLARDSSIDALIEVPASITSYAVGDMVNVVVL